MTDNIETLGDALPKEMARVRDVLMPRYISLGPSGAIGLLLMRRSLDNAARAMAEGDVVAMIAAYKDLQGFEE